MAVKTISRLSAYKQVCVKPPPPSALNMTLPAFAAELRCLQHGTVTRSCRSISPARRALSSKRAIRRCYC